MTAYGSREVAIEAMKRGAYDYLSKPFESDELVLLLRKAEERERLFRENQSLRRELRAGGREPENGLADIVAKSARMVELFRTLRKIAEFKTTVLVGGESGTGKELVARAMHRLSPRSDGPFIAVNCGAIPGSLLESELFGHRKGAFTDANRDKRGLFEEAVGRHPLPRRDRRAAPGAAGQAAAGAAGGGDPPPGRHPGHPGRRPGRRRDRPGSERRGGAGAASARTSSTGSMS